MHAYVHQPGAAGHPTHYRNLEPKIDAKVPESPGACVCISEAPARVAKKCHDTRIRQERGGTRRTSLPEPVTSAAKAAAGAQKQKCREYDYSHSPLGAKPTQTPSRRPRTLICAEPPNVPPGTCPSTSSAASTRPKAPDRAPDRGHAAQAPAQEGAELKAPAREVKEAVLRVRLRRRRPRVKRVAARAARPGLLRQYYIGRQGFFGWVPSRRGGLLPPKPANETQKRVVKLNRPPVAKGSWLPTRRATGRCSRAARGGQRSAARAAEAGAAGNCRARRSRP